jgi:selenide,water dikinase
VLIGGGHTHVHVLRRFAMRPLAGVRITIVSREAHTPYSGMLPGHIAGHYTFDDAHIDLGPLTLAGGARLIVQEVTHLDLSNALIEFADHPPLRFDVVSLNCGAAPGFGGLAIAGAAIPVKPIGRFLPRWQALLASLRQRRDVDTPARIVVVGGGAGGVELTLAIHHAISALGQAVQMSLVTSSARLLEGHNRRVQQRFDALLRARGVEVVPAFEVLRVDATGVANADGRHVPGEFVLWVTGVEAPAWLQSSGLTLEDGFVAVDRHLRSVSDPRVFAAGDVAAMIDQPRAKSGVFAVRQGPVLAENLRRQLLARPLRPYRAQRRVLALISEGGRSATASRGPWFAHGRAMWRWKNWIDRRFMAMYQEVVLMQPQAPRVAPEFARDVPDPMRCGGCGAKLGADVLASIFKRLDVPAHPRLLVGIGDDAAVFDTAARQVVLTADSLRNMLDDPYEFGRIAARHALNDVHAMGAAPVTALALVTVPLMGAPQMEQELYLVMRGALDVLGAEGVALAGGHSSEGLELSLGFAVIGDVLAPPLRKDRLTPGDCLVLTRPLGSGVLFAAKARAAARTRWVRSALQVMDTSNRDAARLLREFGARACTDVTGFGLAGHLGEMLRASMVGAELNVNAIPIYEGALELMEAGIASSLQANNEQALADFTIDAKNKSGAHIRLLADPQTAGGLLAGIPADRAEACAATLRRSGYPATRVIGTVLSAGDLKGVIRYEA